MNDQRKAIFLDRDGTLIDDCGYISDPAKVHFIPGVIRALQDLKSAGWLLIVISNQSGIGRGLISEIELQSVEKRIKDELASHDLKLDDALFCFHTPEDNCACRKPAPGLLFQAAATWNIDLPTSWMIGDKVSDVDAGKNAGCQTILIQSKYIKPPAIAQAANLAEVVRMILNHD